MKSLVSIFVFKTCIGYWPLLK